MAIKYSNGIKLNDTDTAVLIPPQATASMRGGIIAKAKTTEDLEVVIDTTTGKAYVTGATATQSLKGLMAAADKTKLDGIAEGANNYVHPDTHAATMIVEDATHKFVTEAQIAAWSAKADTKEDVGLGNVTNDAQVKRSEMGVASGVATLDTNGKVPAAQLPSYVDDVIEATTKANLPTTGETGKIYVTTNDNLTYRWSGSQYVEISSSLALGETSSTAYAGDKGKANADAINNIIVGNTTVPKASDADTVNGLTVLTAVPENAVFTDTVYTHPATHAATMITEDDTHKFITQAQLTKLDGIAEGANLYVHPDTHAATMIVEDATHKFVTETQIAAWNAKAETTVMTGATASAAGASGLVPMPGAGANVKFLRGDATWVAPTVTPVFDDSTTLISFAING